MVKAKKGKNKKAAPSTSTNGVSSNSTTSVTTTPNSSMTSTTTPSSSNNNNNNKNNNETTTAGAALSGVSTTVMPSMVTQQQSTPLNTSSGPHRRNEDLDDLGWLRDIEMRQASNGEPLLQLEYSDDDELMKILYRFLDESSANSEIIDAVYQMWQQTVLSTLLQSSATWKKENVSQRDQKNMKDTLRVSRLKINFILHHLIGNILISTMKKWIAIRDRVIDMCYNTLQLIPRLVESCQHHPTDVRLAIIHYEGKEFLANVACETWDTIYDYSITIDPHRFVPVLRRCAMLDILDKDWNMLGGWDDILKGLETRCCRNANSGSSQMYTIPRLPSDYILHETTTILRNARNSMQCKFFSVRFMRYTDDQAPQRYRYYPKCSAPACANIETPTQIHPFRCTKCWYFHYCSASCQEYCENIMGLHNKFCTDTPKVKAKMCQKETSQYLGWNIGTMKTTGTNSKATENDEDDDDDDDSYDDPDKEDYATISKLTAQSMVVTCHACGVPEDNMLKMTSSKLSASSASWHNLIKMKRCVQCQRVSYCSRQCQEWDWRVGGHRDVCKVIMPTTTMSNHHVSSQMGPNPNSNKTTTNTAATTTTATTTTNGVLTVPTATPTSSTTAIIGSTTASIVKDLN
jgi:hypothetical protein